MPNATYHWYVLMDVYDPMDWSYQYGFPVAVVMYFFRQGYECLKSSCFRIVWIVSQRTCGVRVGRSIYLKKASHVFYFELRVSRTKLGGMWWENF